MNNFPTFKTLNDIIYFALILVKSLYFNILKFLTMAIYYNK